jgi:hypothetical protein
LKQIKAKDEDIYYTEKSSKTKNIINIKRLSKYIILFIYVSTCEKPIITIYTEKLKNPNDTE